MRKTFLFFLTLFLSFSALAQSEEEKAVLAVVDTFFQAIEDKDTTVANQVLHPDGQFFATLEGGRLIRMTHKAYIKRMPMGKGHPVERYWNPEVHIRGDIATVWAPYDFYVDDKFSHCGIDALDMVRTEGKWMIVGGIFTVEKNTCDSLNMPDRN